MLKALLATVLLAPLMFSPAVAAVTVGGLAFSEASSPEKQTLPSIAPGPGRPYREGLGKSCNSGPKQCLVKFSVVPKGKILKLDKIDCSLGGTTDGLVLTRANPKGAIDAAIVIGFLARTPGGGGLVATGPYYFRPGESPFIVGADNFIICAASGSLHDQK